MNKKLIAILCCIMLTGCTTETKTNKTKTAKEEAPVVLSEEGHNVKEAVNKSKNYYCKDKYTWRDKKHKSRSHYPFYK